MRTATCRVGGGTRIWHFCHLMPGARVGAECVLGQNVFVGGAAAIGDRVKGLRGRDLSLNGVLRNAQIRDADWSVVGKRFALAEGKSHTALQLARRALQS